MQTIFRMSPSLIGAAALATMSLGMHSSAQAVEPASCQAVRFADVGWTDITATTAVVSEILKGIGYKPSAQVLSRSSRVAALKPSSERTARDRELA